MSYKLGARVYSPEHRSSGTVIRLDNDPHPVIVKFDREINDPRIVVRGRNTASFTKDGYRLDAYRSTHPEFQLQIGEGPELINLENIFKL